jgi:tyrosyl-tRNA synthetase
MTSLVHGAAATEAAIAASEILFGGAVEGIAEATFEDVVGEVPTHDVPRDRLSGDGLPIVDLLVMTDLARSKGQARKDVDGGGVSLNNVRVDGPARAVTAGDLLFGKYLLLRRGKRNYAVAVAR